MKNCHRLLLALAALIVLVPGSVPATVGYLMLVNDYDGCEFTDPGNGLVTVHVVHRLRAPYDNSTGVRFRIAAPASWIYVGFETPYVTIGTADVDLSVAYGQCVTENIPVGNARWISMTPAPTCSQLQLLPAQGQDVRLATDCEFTELAIFGYGGVVNGDATCCCDCHPTEQSTWGKVKALYR